MPQLFSDFPRGSFSPQFVINNSVHRLEWERAAPRSSHDPWPNILSRSCKEAEIHVTFKWRYNAQIVPYQKIKKAELIHGIDLMFVLLLKSNSLYKQSLLCKRTCQFSLNIAVELQVDNTQWLLFVSVARACVISRVYSVLNFWYVLQHNMNQINRVKDWYIVR